MEWSTGPGASRRAFLTATATSFATFATADAAFPGAARAAGEKVLVLGGTGFVGAEVVRKLKAKGVDVVATSRNGRDGTAALDITAPGVDVAKEVEGLARGCTAVVSCVGSIGSPDDARVNAASGVAAAGAKAAGVKRFVYVSVAPEVRDAAGGFPIFKDYMAGKASSEAAIKANFGSVEGLSYTLIGPTFIYGGNEFGLTPPRVATGYGRFIDGLLSTPPARLVAKVAPGIVGVAFEPPIYVEAVAGACVAGALGLAGSVVDTHDKIIAASELV